MSAAKQLECLNKSKQKEIVELVFGESDYTLFNFLLKKKSWLEVSEKTFRNWRNRSPGHQPKIVQKIAQENGIEFKRSILSGPKNINGSFLDISKENFQDKSSQNVSCLLKAIECNSSIDSIQFAEEEVSLKNGISPFSIFWQKKYSDIIAAIITNALPSKELTGVDAYKWSFKRDKAVGVELKLITLNAANFSLSEKGTLYYNNESFTRNVCYTIYDESKIEEKYLKLKHYVVVVEETGNRLVSVLYAKNGRKITPLIRERNGRSRQISLSKLESLMENISVLPHLPEFLQPIGLKNYLKIVEGRLLEQRYLK